MMDASLRDLFRCQRGIALPTALIALVILTTLIVAFGVLSKSEPIIASNQVLAAQARALAESGVEQAIWALTTTSPYGIPDPMAGAIATTPYDGSSFLGVGGVGGFFATVSTGAASNERAIQTNGYAPAYSATGLTGGGAPIAHKRILLTLTKVKWLDPPGALSVRGELEIKGSGAVSSAEDTSCGSKVGSYSTGATNLVGGAVAVNGADGNTTANQQAAAPAVTDIRDSTNGGNTTDFDKSIFSDSDLNTLKALAKAEGHYYQGSTTFSSSNPLPSSGGIVFVDTASGNNLSCDTATPTNCSNPSSDFITVTLGGAGSLPPFQGWLIVNGSISWSGNYKVNGLVYAQNDITISGTPTVNGAILSRNIKDTSLTSIDTSLTGNVTINYNCAYAKTGGGKIPTTWFPKAGTYREVSN